MHFVSIPIFLGNDLQELDPLWPLLVRYFILERLDSPPSLLLVKPRFGVLYLRTAGSSAKLCAINDSEI